MNVVHQILELELQGTENQNPSEYYKTVIDLVKTSLPKRYKSRIIPKGRGNDWLEERMSSFSYDYFESLRSRSKGLDLWNYIRNFLLEMYRKDNPCLIRSNDVIMEIDLLMVVSQENYQRDKDRFASLVSFPVKYPGIIQEFVFFEGEDQENINVLLKCNFTTLLVEEP